VSRFILSGVYVVWLQFGRPSKRGVTFHDYEHGIAVPSLVLAMFSPFLNCVNANIFYSSCIFIVVEPKEGTSLVLQDWIACSVLLHELRPGKRSFALHVNSQHHFRPCRKV
jgi:hypothetical protein